MVVILREMMKNLVATNIRKSFDGLNPSVARSSFRELVCPLFTGPRQHITCAEPDFLGFYVLACAMRSLLRGVNFLVASQTTRQRRLLAPSVTLSYTGAFHALMAHLALEGRPHFDWFGWNDRRVDGTAVAFPESCRPQIIVAILKSSNAWCFECRKRSHKARWRELLQIWATSSYDIPKYYHQLFEYMFWGRQKKRISLRESLQNPALREANRLQLEDAMEEFLDRIAEVRHRAVYSAIGEDPRAVEAMWNHEVVSASAMERQALEFGLFCEAMLDHVTADVVELILNLHPTPSIMNVLLAGIYFPGLDTPAFDDVLPEELRSRIGRINGWLMSKAVPEDG